MDKNSIEHLISLVKELDDTMREMGWRRDNRIELSYRYKGYSADLNIQTVDDEDDE